MTLNDTEGGDVMETQEMVYDDEMLAPRDKAWHVEYAKTMQEIFTLLHKLQGHPSFEDGEDLKDWVIGFATMHSFRPLTREDLEREGRALVEG